MEKFEINTIPSLTWNWMKMNKDSVEVTTAFTEISPSFNTLPEGITLSEGKFSEEGFGTGIFNIRNPKQLDSRYEYTDSEKEQYEKKSEHSLLKLVSEISKTQIFTISGKTEPLILNFTGEVENQISDTVIHAKGNCDSTVIFIFNANAQTQLIRTRILAEENAKIHIVKVQINSNSTLQLDDTAFICNENVQAKFTQIELGGKHTDSGLNVNLNGYKADFKSNIAYLCKEEQYLDMNHIVNHFGKKTECNMQVKGTLKDNSTKIYRGTIDFKNGCCGSKGNELEETLLLNPKVINKSLPVILCDEEDVEGEHGASIGRLSNEILFYMQSRGIDKKSAEEIMSIAKIQATADLIPDEKTKELILEYLEK